MTHPEEQSLSSGSRVKGYSARSTQSVPWFTLVIIAFVAIISFGLGRLSALPEPATRGLEVVYPSEYSATLPPRDGEGRVLTAYEPAVKNFLASINGTRYYLPSCPSAQRIAKRNVIWFATRDEAEQSGYTKAKNCPGL